MSTTTTDVAILGAGPAGISAAMWLGKFGVDYLMIDGEDRIGGELMRINLPIRDYPGLELVHGQALRNRLELAMQDRPLHTRLGEAILAIDPDAMTVKTSGGEIAAKVIILALGLSRRRMALANEADYRGKSLSYSATSDMDWLKGKPVAVVGGGDGACENALLLAEHSPQVYLVHRRERLRARPEFIEAVENNGKITLLTRREVTALHGENGELSAIALSGPAGDDSLDVTRLVVKIGFEPNSHLLPEGAIELDAAGYVKVDRFLHSSRPAILAMGDLSNPHSPCISAAIGDGAVAAREAYTMLGNQAKTA